MTQAVDARALAERFLDLWQRQAEAAMTMAPALAAAEAIPDEQPQARPAPAAGASRHR